MGFSLLFREAEFGQVDLDNSNSEGSLGQSVGITLLVPAGNVPFADVKFLGQDSFNGVLLSDESNEVGGLGGGRVEFGLVSSVSEDGGGLLRDKSDLVSILVFGVVVEPSVDVVLDCVNALVSLFGGLEDNNDAGSLGVGVGLVIFWVGVGQVVVGSGEEVVKVDFVGSFVGGLQDVLWVELQ